MNKEKNNYDSSAIDILEGLEPVRLRPGMYIGNTGTKGLHHLIWEILDNSIDEYFGGYCSEIEVIQRKDGGITITDNGRGIPIDKHPKANIPTLRVILTVLHAGGKFKQNAYPISGGLHGVGSSVVNALSSRMIATVWKDGIKVQDVFEKGNPITKLSPSNEYIIAEKKTKHPNGTSITFYPDPTIFEVTEFKSHIIRDHLEQTSFLNQGIKIVYRNEKEGSTDVFYSENGIQDFMRKLTEKEEVVTQPIYLTGEINNCKAEVCMQLTDEPIEKMYSYVNGIVTPEEGTHVTGFRSGLTKCINSYQKELGFKEALQGSDIRNGMVCILSLKMPDPQFEGQTKSRLGTSSAKTTMDQFITTYGPPFFDRNVSILNQVVQHALSNQQTRKKLDIKKIEVPKGFEISSKLADCHDVKTHPERCEIFIVEGDSAGGSAKTARNRATQAVLPLRGKIINVEKASIEKILSNLEIQTMISAFGTGYGESFCIDKLRYDKIIIMTDADVDGSHIATLLLTFFYRFFPELILTGHIYIAQTPLFILTTENKKKVETVYCYNDKDLKETQKKLRREGTKITRVSRAKGLGELDADQLKIAALNEDTRRLIPVEMEDLVSANAITSLLMGTEVNGRRDLIVKHALDAKI